VTLDVQLAFRQEQARLDCTDCPLGDVRPGLRTAGLAIENHGYGTVVSSRDSPTRELHIFPHCGIELPTELLEAVGAAHFGDLASLVHDNADTGSLAMYRLLALQIARGELPGAAMAGFHLSRLLVDSNRILPEDRTPLSPYSGGSELYRDYMIDNRPSLLHSTNLWLERVNSLLAESDDLVVYHHHTYEPVSLGSPPHELAPGAERPGFQLFWRRPSIGRDPNTDEGLAPLAMVESVVGRMRRFWAPHVPRVEGAIDFPLMLPVTPFAGCVNDGQVRRHVHIIYEVRKDLIRQQADIARFADENPWRVPIIQ
jgi:hypothetical protein